MSEMRLPLVISTFAGCGGSSLGYKLAGFKEILAIEWDSNAVETFKLNFPEVPIWQRDINEITGKEILYFCKIKKGELDVFDGSPPCQGFSTAGKRVVSDLRNDLFKQYTRLLTELQPKVFVMENVSGMIKGTMKGKFLEILAELKSCGYNVKCKLMNAMWYNVPQSRERVIFVGVRKDLSLEPVFPEPSKTFITCGSALKNITDNGKPLTPEAKKYYNKMKPGEAANKYHPKGHLFGLIKLNPNKPAPTQTRSAGASKPVHWIEERFIGNKERTILQSFPESFLYSGGWVDIYNRIGNSVPPNLMKAIAETIKTEILYKINHQIENDLKTI